MAPPEKVGAGLLLLHGGECLLLLRSKNSGNPCTWGLPGGNAEPGEDASLLETARREASEECGPVPPFTVQHEVLTRRGKHGQKHFTVFIATTPTRWEPTLNHEHTEFRWLPLPFVKTCAAASGGACALLPAGVSVLPLHPVVMAAFAAAEEPLAAAAAASLNA
jgi:8-oxo-dGTP pyrophosphatase MutT (NUDIX family)